LQSIVKKASRRKIQKAAPNIIQVVERQHGSAGATTAISRELPQLSYLLVFN